MARNFLLALAVAAASSEALLLRGDPTVKVADEEVQHSDKLADSGVETPQSEVVEPTAQAPEVAQKADGATGKSGENLPELKKQSAISLKFWSSKVGSGIAKGFRLNKPTDRETLKKQLLELVQKKGGAELNKKYQTVEQITMDLSDLNVILALADFNKEAKKAAGQEGKKARSPEVARKKNKSQDQAQMQPEGESPIDSLNPEQMQASKEVLEAMAETATNEGQDRQKAREAVEALARISLVVTEGDETKTTEVLKEAANAASGNNVEEASGNNEEEASGNAKKDAEKTAESEATD